MKTKEKEFMNPPANITAGESENKETAIKIYTIEEVKEADKHAKKVTSELGKAEKAFTQVACEMAWLYEDERYKALESASSFDQFALNRFGFKKTQSYGLVAMVNRFGVKGEDGTYTIEEKYKKYSHTKLILMCNARLTDEEIFANTSPTMTVNELKKVIKNLTSIEACNGDSTATVVDECTTTVVDECTTTAPVESVINGSNDSNIIDSTATVHDIVTLATYTCFKEFEADSANFFQLVANAFNSGKTCKVSICYE